jgi:hypothetical protein
MKTGRVDCICGDQIISNSGKTMNKADDWKKIACWGCGKLYKFDLVEEFRVEGEAVTYSMKIFKMNEYDWWMDIDLESAKKNCTKYCEEIDTDPADVKKAYELTDVDLDVMSFIADGDNGPKCTFREQMNRMDQVPQFFASTEY